MCSRNDFHFLLKLTLSQVLLGRVDADVERGLLGEILGGHETAAQHLPAIVLWTPKRKSSRNAILYDGAHERRAITEFVHKQLEQPARKLTSIAAVEGFVKDPTFKTTSSAPDVVTVRWRLRWSNTMEVTPVETGAHCLHGLSCPTTREVAGYTLWLMAKSHCRQLV